MRFLASLAMRGRSQAVMTATVLAILALPVPPLSILSGAVVALVTLRKSIWEGLLVLGLSVVACAALSMLLFSNVLPVIGYVLLMWLPVWLLGSQLRVHRSLSVTLVLALLLALLVLAGQYLQEQNPVDGWRELLEPFVASMVDAQMVDAGISEQLIETMSAWMPGAIAVGFFLQSMAALLTARWWQAALYNPGGFRAEFHQLRLPKVLALVTLLALVMNWLVSEIGVPTYLVMLLLAGWFIQGISLAHAVQTRLGANILWLVAMYVLLIFAMPYMVGALAIAGFADSWVDFRARLGSASHSGKTS